jgi:hypothetical protein
MRRRRTTPNEKGYTEMRQDPGEKTTNRVLWNNVQRKLFLWCLDEPLHVA